MMASLFTFENLYNAYVDCRRRKRGKKAALSFEMCAEDNLFALAKELADRTYHPSPSFCFVSRNDKFREIFAAQFKDRVVHHLIVRYLERIWEPVFIHDSYACRKGKGTHAAVKRLQSFTRKVTCNSTKRAWFLQLDIKAFFPSIDRQLLLNTILSRLDNDEMRWLAEAVILHDPVKDAVFTCRRSKWDNIPPHKSLFTVPAGKGLPIGNLTSQFFANVYLNSIDQFVKHSLKARYYIRYVDDFILLHERREQLIAYKDQIEDFLQDVLKLEMHPDRQRINPVANGTNFLGYIVRPSHLLVRRRVVGNCRRAIASYQNAIEKTHKDVKELTLTPDSYEKFMAVINSYLGALRYAASYSLIQKLFQRFSILDELFIRNGCRVIKRWDIPYRPADLYTQYSFFRTRFRGVILFQVGCFLELFDGDAVWANATFGMKRIAPRKGFHARCGVSMHNAESLVEKLSRYNFLLILQSYYIHGKVDRRFVNLIHFVINKPVAQ